MQGGRFVVGLLAAALLPLIPGVPPAEAGQLDPAFGTNGIAHFDAAYPVMDHVNATARSWQNAEVTVAGRVGGRFAVGRVEAERRDTPLSLTTVDFGVPSEAFGLAPTVNGVLAVGTAGGDFALATLTDTLNAKVGYPDQGRVRTSFGAEAVARDTDIDEWGVVAVGSVEAGRGSSLAIARYQREQVVPDGFPTDIYHIGPGGLDLGFGDGGTLIDDVTPGDDIAYAVLPRNVVAGKAGGAALLAKYERDGTPSPYLGTQGKVFLDLTTGDDVAYSVVSDGSSERFRYLVAGSAGPDAFVASLHGDGTPDLSFGTNGVLRMSLGGQSRFTSIDARFDSTRIAASFLLSGVVTGTGGDDALLVRITPDGRLDSSFGSGGVVVTDLGGPTDQVAGATVAQSSSFPYGGPYTLAGGDGKDGLVVTFDANGKRVDTTRLGFGLPVDDSVHASSRLADGRTLILGTRSPYGGPFLARLLPDGSPDLSFGSGGLIDPALGATIVPLDMAVTADGGILALLRGSVSFVVRFLPDGRRDASYGTLGAVSLGYGQTEVHGILTLADGRVVVTVGSTSYWLSTTGQRDMSRGGGDSVWGHPSARLPEPDGGFLAFSVERTQNAPCFRTIRVDRYRADGTRGLAWCGGPDMAPMSVLRRPDGRILVAGVSGDLRSFWDIGDDTVIASFLPSGAVDPSFGTSGFVRLDVAERDNRVLLALGPAGTVLFATEGYRQLRPHLGLGRLLPDGRVDRTFAPRGITELKVAPAPLGIAVLPDGKVVIAATVEGKGGHDVGLIRYVPGGQAIVSSRVVGWNGVGALGNGTLADSRTPVVPLGVVNARQVSAGWYHSLAVLDDGSVMAWGWNVLGQLGNGTTTDSAVPVRVTGLPRIVSVAAGGLHSMALAADGSVWTWGWNGFGQLGNGTASDSLRPVRAVIPAMSTIAAGGLHSLALASDGVVWRWGWNALGQLGIGTTTDAVWPTPGVGEDKLIKIAAGDYHSLGLNGAGTVYAWGWNIVGQLGLGTTVDVLRPTGVPGIENAIEVAAGGLHSLAVTTKTPGDLDGGSVLAWGWNGVGQLGDGSTATRLSPVAIPGLTGILKVAGGTLHSVAMGAGGAVWTWGWNAGGQLGEGTLTDRHVPWRVATVVDGTTVAAGAFHTMMG